MKRRNILVWGLIICLILPSVPLRAGDLPPPNVEPIDEEGGSGGNNKPIAKFYIDPSDPTSKQEVEFVDRSYDPDVGDYIVEWEWDFGDGGTATFSRPFTHTFHTYVNTEDKYFTAKLRVKDNHGKWSDWYELNFLVYRPSDLFIDADTIDVQIDEFGNADISFNLCNDGGPVHSDNPNYKFYCYAWVDENQDGGKNSRVIDEKIEANGIKIVTINDVPVEGLGSHTLHVYADLYKDISGYHKFVPESDEFNNEETKVFIKA